MTFALSHDPKVWLLVSLGAFTIFHLSTLTMAIVRNRRASRTNGAVDSVVPSLIGIGTGFLTNFFDTLGVGSFAPTTAIFRMTGSVSDERIPGTLNVGHTLPIIAQAFIFTTAVDVDATTLVSMILAAVLGAWLGAGVVTHWPRRRIQIGMGVCLVAAAALTVLQALNLMPGGGDALAVTGARLAVALAGNFVLGALMTLGIGLYGPCLVLVSLLGMSPIAAFPIMMGSCAFLMPVASHRFTVSNRFDIKAAIGLIVGGIPAVLIAAFIVGSLPLAAVRWLVVAVVLYTAFTLLKSARVESVSVAQP